ncbi:MAG: complex I subunit 4 family protein [Isosphaeraceae bacterium]
MATLLVITIFLPIAGSIALAFVPRDNPQMARGLAMGVGLITLAASLVLLSRFDSAQKGPQFSTVTEGHYGISWGGSLGENQTRPDIRVAFGLDGLSLWMFVLTSLLMITAMCSSWTSVKERVAAHFGFLLALETGLLGLFASLDVILFYIFFEFTLIPLFFLIGIWGGPQRRRASVTFFLYTLAGSLLTLLGVIALVVIHYNFTPGKVLTFSIPELTNGLSSINWPAWRDVGQWSSLDDIVRTGPSVINWKCPQVIVFLLLLAGFAVKVPMFPVHTWLPLAHVEAPTAGSVVLAGVLLKVGTYGLLRFNLGMTPLASLALFPFIATIAVIGIIYGALAALAQTDVKRLVAYSSVSHMGFIVLGLFALNATGMEGGVIQMLNHGLTTGALFACVGVIYERYHTRSMDEMSGLWKVMPLLAFFFILASLGSAALPGLNGFVGEFPILIGAYATSPTAGVLAATGMILGAYYLLWMLRRVVFGPLRVPEAHGDTHTTSHGHGVDGHHGAPAACPPLGWHDIAGLAPLMILIVGIGVYPRPIIEQIQPPVHDLLNNLELQRERIRADRTDQTVREQPPSTPRGGGKGSGAPPTPRGGTKPGEGGGANTKSAAPGPKGVTKKGEGEAKNRAGEAPHAKADTKKSDGAAPHGEAEAKTSNGEAGHKAGTAPQPKAESNGKSGNSKKGGS